MANVKDVVFIAMVYKVKLSENGLSFLRGKFPKRLDGSLHRFSMFLCVRSCICIRSRTTGERSLLRAQGRALELLDDFVVSQGVVPKHNGVLEGLTTAINDANTCASKMLVVLVWKSAVIFLPEV